MILIVTRRPIPVNQRKENVSVTTTDRYPIPAGRYRVTFRQKPARRIGSEPVGNNMISGKHYFHSPRRGRRQDLRRGIQFVFFNE